MIIIMVFVFEKELGKKFPLKFVDHQLKDFETLYAFIEKVEKELKWESIA